MTAPNRPRPDVEPQAGRRSSRRPRSTVLRFPAVAIVGTLGSVLGPAAVAAPAVAQSPTSAPAAPTSSASPVSTAARVTTAPTTAKPRLDGAIAAPRVLANGSLRFTPPPASLRPKTNRTKARGVADKVVPSSAAGRAAEAFFALFSASSPARRAADGTVVAVFDRRPVWVVRYAAVKGERQTGVVVRRAGTTLQPTTTLNLTVRTDIVVVIDDATAAEVLRSEYAS